MSVKNNISTKYFVWIAVLAIAILAGLFTTYKVLTNGLGLYSANDVIVWTLPLASYAFFSLMSAGLAMVASIPIVFGIDRYLPLVKRAVVLSLAALVAALLSTFLELGTPWHIVAYFISPNPRSSLWWLGVLYLLQFVFLVTFFVKSTNGKYNKVISLIVFLLAIAIASTLGSTFGFVEARSVYYGPFIPVYFLLTAFLTGLAVFMLTTLIFYQITKADFVEEVKTLYDELGKAFSIILGLSLIFFVWMTVTGLYAYSPEYNSIKHVFGSLPYQFALWLGLVVPLTMMIIPVIRQSRWGKVVSTALVVLGTLTISNIIIELGMTVPPGPRITQFPELAAPSYTVWEWLVFVFALAVALLIYTLGERYFELEGSAE
ncbi:MAG: hypothetical protein MAG431_01786 [Chloroflexi bacterium]|nr:hypothetical protein [Chloroflexota bacterium]